MARMRPRTPGAFGAQLKAHREAAGFTQEELATIAGLSVHAVDSLMNDIGRVLGHA
jgi:transcriptional regulator with XRE-family HTH domain